MKLDKSLIQEAINLLDSAIDTIDGRLDDSMEYQILENIISILENEFMGEED